MSFYQQAIAMSNARLTTGALHARLLARPIARTTLARRVAQRTLEFARSARIMSISDLNAKLLAVRVALAENVRRRQGRAKTVASLVIGEINATRRAPTDPSAAVIGRQVFQKNAKTERIRKLVNKQTRRSA